ncbi:MAG: alpha/beta fold hydrolase [Ferruginibacter sp.]
MKHLFSILSFIFFSFNVFAQSDRYTGTWEGDLDAGIQKLRLVFAISSRDNGSLKFAMQSPQQSAMYMTADTAYIDAVGQLFMEMKKFGISFKGSLQDDSTLSGEFVQGKAFPMQLKKVVKASAVEKPKRPQTPRAPFPYKSMDISFANKNNSIRFGGTLTVPDTSDGKKYPAVILITGSGAQDRDETMMGHKPFAVIADYLSRNGIAVLRVDDRGVGKTTGNPAMSTSQDFADDKEAALDYLEKNKWIDPKRIGLIGHSEGGMIAPLLAAKRKDIKAIVLLAGPGINGAELLAKQNVAIFRSNGVDAAAADAYGIMFKEMINRIIRAKDSAAALAAATAVLEKWNVDPATKKLFKVDTKENRTTFAGEMVDELYSPWFKYFLAYEPAPALKKLSCNVLALNGSRDIQVLPQPNLAGIENALKKSRSKSYEVKEVPGLNHLFQACNACTLDEYAKLEESFSPQVLSIINDWLQKNL